MCNKMLSISRNLRKTVLKVKNDAYRSTGWLCAYQPFILVMTWLPGSRRLLPSITSFALHMASLGKDPDSKFKVWFLTNAYGFCNIVQLKNPKSNHSSQGLSVRRFLFYTVFFRRDSIIIYSDYNIWINCCVDTSTWA